MIIIADNAEDIGCINIVFLHINSLYILFGGSSELCTNAHLNLQEANTMKKYFIPRIWHQLKEVSKYCN